ncbi:UPF0390 protein [Acrodontium crateriforme]|uniref:UPF0390 protein n=1 Tax=Acrodontium crateriforme TaxID=150365 RepID=A0AAQ3RAA6_9PEZI|nr:UPF0390 protein [Acrodontium crateriforme]
MAQGVTKKAKLPTAKPTQRKQTGARIIKPKKPALVKQNQMKKKHSAGLAAMTEKALAGKAGHLELLRGGKKDKIAEKKGEKKKEEGKK